MSFSFGAPSTAAKPAFGGFSTPNPSTSTNTGGSLFGQAPQNPSNPSTSLFGSSTQPQQQQQPAASGSGTGLFGSTVGQASGTTTGGLFGSTAGQNQPQTQAQPTGGLFGSTTQPAQGQQGGGLFGSTSQQPQQQPQQQQQQAGGGMFGNSSTTGGGLFGSQAAKPAGSGLFGSTTAQPATAGGSGLFGSSNTQQQQQQQQPATGGLFGSSAQQSQAGSSMFGGFGQQSQNQAAKPAGGLFGNFGASTSQPQQQPQQQQQQQQQQSSLFGSTNAGFGQSTAGPMNASTSAAANPFGVKQELDIGTRIQMVQNAWDTNNPDCRFKYYFYNVVEEGTAGRYGRPANATDETKWVKALRDNPDPNSMVPVLATGWADVKKRQQAQENLASVHQQKTKELTQALSHTRQTSLSASIRLSNLQAQQTQLLHRLIHLVAQTPQFVPLIQSTGFRTEEAEMLAQLEGVKAELEGKGKNAVRASSSVGLSQGRSGTPVGGGLGAGANKGRLLGQVNELWGQLEEIRRHRKTRGPDGPDGSGAGNGSWLTDEKALAEVAEILATQQMALQKLSGLVHDAVFDADVMRQGLGMINSAER